MSATATTSKFRFFTYRLSTIFRSFKALCTLPPEKVDAFLNSYNIYNHDWVNEEELIKDMGVDYYKEVQKKIIDYYSVLNHLCAIGQVEKMYIPPAIDLSASIIANQTLFEKRMSRDLGIQAGYKVLDVGCGRGRVANHIASITGAQVTGMNIDPDQLESATQFALRTGRSSQCQFKQGDLNAIPFPFPDNSFDAVYQIQAFSLSKDLEKLFKDLYRILKPGGKLGCLDWVLLDKYDAKNPYHADLMRRVKPLIGAIGSPSATEYVALLQKAGFKIIINENASIGGYQAPLIENADKFFTRVTKLIKFLVRWRVLPAHFGPLFDRLTKDGEAFVEADRLGLVTTSYYIVAQK